MAAPAVDQAFEDLYASYSREVYRYVLALLRNPAEAEDVTQTTFLNAYRALRAGERPRRPHNWLIAIAHNACRSRVRFAMRRPNEVPLDDVVEQLAVPEAERPNIRELLRTMGRLPVNQRAAITMREFEGRSYVDIAERLGVTVPAAEALIGRARRMLRERAAAFRTLLLVPKPRWFRRFAENGEAAGGAAGTAAAAKVAALLVIGAVGGAVGVVAGSSSQVPSAQAEPAAAARQLASRNSPAALTRDPAVRPAATVVASAAQPQVAPLPADAMPVGPSAAATSSAAVPPRPPRPSPPARRLGPR
jgi:RNA polymerase sigma factor (sigma-70 family)